jgi:hypothetical protein
LIFLPEFCAPVRAFSPKAAWSAGSRLKTMRVKSPPGRGGSRRLRGGCSSPRTHPGAARHPSREGIFRRPAIHVQNSGSNSSARNRSRPDVVRAQLKVAYRMVERELPRAFRLRKESKRAQERPLHPESVQAAHAVRHFQLHPSCGGNLTCS